MMQRQQISLAGEAGTPVELAVHATTTYIVEAVAVSAEGDGCHVVLGENLDAREVEQRVFKLFASQGLLVTTNLVRVEEEPPL